MTGRDRTLSVSTFRTLPDLVGRPLPSPYRRIGGFAIDVLLLLIPSIIVACATAALSLYVTDQAAFQALEAELRKPGEPSAGSVEHLGQLAPLLVRADAEGLPATVAVAVEASDLRAAGEILSGYDIVFALGAQHGNPRRSGTIRVDIAELVPGTFRGAALFGTAAIYFTFFVSGRRRSTPGKRLMGTEVSKLDGRPLTPFEGFERFSGYLASLGTFGLGLLDLWREPNRRLVHDRIADTVVLRRSPPVRLDGRTDR